LLTVATMRDSVIEFDYHSLDAFQNFFAAAAVPASPSRPPSTANEAANAGQTSASEVDLSCRHLANMPDLVPSHHAPAHSQVIFFLFSI
jgi:hypothetical protein